MKRIFAVLIGTLGIVSVGCAQKAEGQPTPTPKPAATACKPDGTNPRPGITVAVFVEYDPGSNAAKTTDKTIYVCEQDKVLWVADCEGDFDEPNFTGPSPFDKPFKHKKRLLKSETLKKGSANQNYDYEVYFKYSGKTPAKIDPRIVVMP